MNVVFGGSFNPPTIAHKSIIELVIKNFDVDTFLVIPVGNDYHKNDLVDYQHRISMLNILVKGMKYVVISDIEANGSYKGTLNLLDQLSKVYKNIHFIIGSDQLYDLTNWIEYDKLLRTYKFIVIKRFGYKIDNDITKKYPASFIYLDLDMDVSSNQIRKNLDEYQSFTTSEVYDYIKKNNLYE